MSQTTEPQITLGGYPAKKCARVTHNVHSPDSPPLGPVAPEVQVILDAGRAFEAAVVEEFRLRFAGSDDLLVLTEGRDWDRTKELTAQAMSDGVPIIVGGRLPDVNGRVGAPDVLVRHGRGYLPVDIKNHKTLNPSANPDSPKAQSKVTVSALGDPDRRSIHRGYSNAVGQRRDDAMQLAHYTRMLLELGLHATTAEDPDPDLLIGGIIGTSDLSVRLDDSWGIVWHALAEATESTYSRSQPGNRTKRTMLERYDHEFAFRIKVAEAARAGRELVRPFRIAECGQCEWFDYCAEVVGPDDASFALTIGHLSVREWQHLYGEAGRLSVEELARTDIDRALNGFREYAVTNGAEARLRNAVRRAAMTVAKVDFEPHGNQWPEVPAADIEVDFDIEWGTDDRIYQWGLRIREGQDDDTARYEPVVSFEELDDAGEAALAAEFCTRITALRRQAARENKTILVFHWDHPERSRTRKFPAVDAALEGITLDLCKWFGSKFFSRPGGSIKVVAPALGFEWKVDDPGGLVSLERVMRARGTGPDAEEARQWCLKYNESDVAAQAAIRDGLREMSCEISGSARPGR